MVLPKLHPQHQSPESVPPPNLTELFDFLGLELIDSRVALVKLHLEYTESKAASRLHVVVAPKPSTSISLQMESKSVPPPELVDLA